MRLDERHTNQVWFVRLDEHPIVIKVFAGQQDDGAAREWAALELFSTVSAEQVPEPLFCDLRMGVIAMSRVAGEPLADRDLTAAQVESLASWLSLIGSSRPTTALPLARTAPIALVPRTRMAWERARDIAVDDPVVTQALTTAGDWLATNELDSLLDLTTSLVSRGDTNLANCLWDGSKLRMVDFEDAGWNHAAVQIGDYMEHIRAHQVPDSTWNRLIDLTDQRPAFRTAVLTARRRYAIFWLTHLLPGGRAADRNPPGTTRRQAERVLRLVEG